jgi:hypothetical protein
MSAPTSLRVEAKLPRDTPATPARADGAPLHAAQRAALAGTFPDRSRTGG